MACRELACENTSGLQRSLSTLCKDVMDRVKYGLFLRFGNTRKMVRNISVILIAWSQADLCRCLRSCCLKPQTLEGGEIL